VAYELYVGPLPADLSIDHLCRNRSCVNPRHLEAVPIRVNIQRANPPLAYCHRGHPFDEDNARFTRTTGKRRCRQCTNAWARASRAPTLKGHARGESYSNAKLTWQRVAEIRARWVFGKRGVGIRALAKEYGVGYSTMYHALRGGGWREEGAR
jgi:hypothetical protein